LEIKQKGEGIDKSTIFAGDAVINLKESNHKDGILDIIIKMLAFVMAFLISIKHYKSGAYASKVRKKKK
jgi:hypothetical protein